MSTSTATAAPMRFNAGFVQLPRLSGPEGEAQWLKDRQRVTTATEAARLMAASGVKGAIRDYVEAKRNPQNFKANRAMRWGHEREDHIISEAARLTGRVIEHNEQLCVNLENTAHGATPDGLTEDAVAEAKTFNSATENFLPDLYFFQMQWQMYVCEKQECIYAYEVHEDYKPVERDDADSTVHVEIIKRDQKLIDSMVERVAEAEAACGIATEYSAELDELIRELAEVQARKKLLESRETELKNRVKKLTGAGVNEYAYGSATGKITAIFPKPREVFDFAKLREEHPRIWKDYGKQYLTHKAQSAPTLKITPAKEVKTFAAQSAEDAADVILGTTAPAVDDGEAAGNAETVRTPAQPKAEPAPKRLAPTVSF